MRQVGREWQARSHLAPETRARPAVVAAILGTRGTADVQEASGDRVELARIELVKVALGIDEDAALQRGLGDRVEAQAVVREVVEDLEGQDEAWGCDVAGPVEDGLVDDFDFGPVPVGVERAGEVLVLEVREGVGDLDDLEFRAGVDFRVGVADVVEDVEHEGAVAGSHLVYKEVVVWIQR